MPKERTITTTEFKEMIHLDYLLILNVKQLREEQNWSQQELSEKMGVTKSFVGNVESLIQRHKYGIRHLALLAKALNKPISEIFNFPMPKFDKILLTMKVTTVLRVNGNVKSKSIEVMKIEPVVES